MKKVKLSWIAVEKLVNKIAKDIKEDDLHLTKLKGIYGVTRGGLIPAVMLSHRLDLPMSLVTGSEILAVDDISDTGDTLADIDSYFTATLITKTSSRRWPTFTGQLTNDKIWYIFPWETELSSRRDNKKL